MFVAPVSKLRLDPTVSAVNSFLSPIVVVAIVSAPNPTQPSASFLSRLNRRACLPPMNPFLNPPEIEKRGALVKDRGALMT